MTHTTEHIPISVPPPLLVIVEDVGWWSGFSGPGSDEPFRTGLGRNHGPGDYTALVRLARSLKTQILAGVVLCEWDRDGLLRDLPSSTWKGRDWTGCGIGRAFQDEAVSILNHSGPCVALALHGVGHEFWTDGRMSRTEFHDEQGVMRDQGLIRQHLSFFGKLLETSGLEAPFPRVFIPPALLHSFGNGDEGVQNILSDFGIEYVLTVFDKARQYRAPLTPHVTSECGVTLIERGLSPVSWDIAASRPRFDFSHPVLPLHWANLIHHDPMKNDEVIDAWAAFLLEGTTRRGFIILPDVMATLAQIVCHHLLMVSPSQNSVTVDLSLLRHVKPRLKNPVFYMTLPSTARLDGRNGVMEPADSIRPGLFRITAAADRDQILLKI